MRKIFQNIILWIYLKIHTIFFAISVALFNTEIEILKADPNNINEKGEKNQRMHHRNQLLEKFYAGQTDKKYVREYYEVLKKTDKFIRTATPRQMAIAADKYGTNYGMKDRYGRRYEHYGFFDDKHKYAGKTLGEVIALEFEERRTKDDDFEILYIFNNRPIEIGFTKITDIIEENKDGNKLLDLNKKSKQYKFPIKIIRETKAINKIEELTEFLHVKKIGFEYRQLEFFVPLKFKTFEIEDNSDIFKEIINIKEVFIYDEYGQLMGFSINNFQKRIIYNDTYEVFKFQGIEIQTMGLNT